MWRSVAKRAIRSIEHPSQLLPHQTRTFCEFNHSPTRSDLYSCVSSNTIFHLSPRFISHYSSNAYRDSEELHSESAFSGEYKDDIFVGAHKVIDETPSSISSEFKEDDNVHDANNASFFDGTGDNMAKNGFVSGNDESVVEDEKTKEVDLEKLESVLSLLQSSGSLDGSLESNLEYMGLELNEEFVMRVLETPFIPGENLTGFFKWVSKRQEFYVTARAVEALVCSKLRKENAYALWDLIKEIGEKDKSVLHTEILNKLISLCSSLGNGKVAFEIFDKFGEFGCVPNADTYYFTVKALCRPSFYDWACSVCEKMLNAEQLPDAEKIGKIISCLCKGTKAKDAHMIYSSAKKKERYPPQSSVNFLIRSLCRQDDAVYLALEMLTDFTGERQKCAIQPFSSVIQGLCRIKDFEEGKKLLFNMIDAGPPPGNEVFNMMINALCKAGDMEEATKMMKVMEGRGLKPDVYTYTVIMSGYSKCGAMEEACKILSEAKKKHSKLCPATYHTLVRGYCKLEQFDKALVLFREMEEYGVQPKADEYSKLIQSLCLKALDWKTSETLLEEMNVKGIHLNGITKALIRAVKELKEETVKMKEVAIEA